MQRSMIAEIRPLPGQEDHVVALVTTLARHVRQEPGNVLFLPYSITGENAFEVLEVYRNDAAFEDHLHQPYVATFNNALKSAAIGGKSNVRNLQDVATGPPARPLPARGVDHIGITVPDVDSAAHFFEQAFGAVAVYDVLPLGGKPMQGADTEHQLGLTPGASIVHMRLMRIGDGPSLELFQIDGATKEKPVTINGMGLTHIGLYVDDIQAAAARFQAAGGTLLSPVHPLAGVEAGKQNAGVYGTAPWGSLIELLTYPDGITYTTNSHVTRWTPPIHSTLQYPRGTR